MRTYLFEVVIEEGNNEFWEELGDKSGCDEILEELKDHLEFHLTGFDCMIKLKAFKNE